MSTIKNIAKNTILLVSSNFVSLALSFIINMYIARYIGVDGYGIINAALNLATLFAYIADLGISTFVMLHLSRTPEDMRSYMNNALSVKIILSMAALAGLVATAVLTNYSGVKLLVLVIIGVYVILTAITQIFQATFQAFQSMEYNAVSQLIQPVILALGMLYVIYTGSGVVAFAIIYLVAGAITLIFNVAVIAKRYAWPVPAVNIGLWKSLLIGGLPFSLSVILYFLFFKIDIQLINLMIGDAGVGYYSAAFKIIESVMSIPVLFTTAIFPLMSLYFHKNSSNLKVLLDKSIKYLLIVGVPASIGLYLLADKVIFFCYQDKYTASIAVLQPLCLGLLIIFINAVPSSFLTASNMQKTIVYYSAVAAVINIVLNIVFIPVYGIVGSAYTMVVTEAVLSVCAYYFFLRTARWLPSPGDILRIAGCSLAMGAFVYCVHGWNMALVIASAMILYFILIVATGALSRDDISMISEIFMREKPIAKEV